MSKMFWPITRKKRLDQAKNQFSTAKNLWSSLLLSSHNIHVNEESALQVPAFKACVDLIAKTIATLPLKIYSTNSNGEEELNVTHKLNSVLQNPFDNLTRYDSLFPAIANYVMSGEAYFILKKNRAGLVKQMRSYHPSSFTVEDKGNRLDYRYEGQPINTNRLIHIRGFTRDGINGESVLEKAKDAIQLSLTIDRSLLVFFENDLNPASVVEYPGRLSEEAQARFLQTWNKGSREAGKTQILEDGAKLTTTRQNNNNTELSLVRLQQAYKICQHLGVPPNMIGLLDRATHNNTSQQELEFYKHTILPICSNIERAFKDLFLLSEQELNSIKFDVRGLLRADPATRAEYYNKMFLLGTLTINEIRDLENFKPVGKKGDDLYVQANLNIVGNEEKNTI